MMPISEIHEGDQFENPMLRPNGLTWVVSCVKEKEKMIQVTPINLNSNFIGKPIWKKNTDKMFSESWKVFSKKSFADNRSFCS